MHAAFRARCLIQAGREAHADPALPLPTLTRATATSSKELFFSGRSTRRPATDTLAPAPTPASDLQPPSDRHASLDRGPRLVPLHRHAAMPLPAGDRLAGSTAPQARPSAYASPPANRKRAQTLRSPASPGSVFVSPCASRHRTDRQEGQPAASEVLDTPDSGALLPSSMDAEAREQAQPWPGFLLTFRPTDTPRSRKGPWHVLLHRRTAMPLSAGDRPASDLPPDRHAPLEEKARGMCCCTGARRCLPRQATPPHTHTSDVFEEIR